MNKSCAVHLKFAGPLASSVLRSLLSPCYHSPFLSFLLLLSFCWPLLFFCRMRDLGRRPLGPWAPKVTHPNDTLLVCFKSKSHRGQIFMIFCTFRKVSFFSIAFGRPLFRHFSILCWFWLPFWVHFKMIFDTFRMAVSNIIFSYLLLWFWTIFAPSKT